MKEGSGKNAPVVTRLRGGMVLTRKGGSQGEKRELGKGVPS